jgi:ribonuclease VapC
VIVDTSALAAIIFGEPEGPAFLRAILAEEGGARISAVTLVELTMVVEGRAGPAAGAELDELLRRLALRVQPVTEEAAQAAREAWRRYGRGRHPAGLNLGDCFSYALATMTGAALLYKGADFSQTDVKAAL